MGLRKTFGTDKELETKGVAFRPDPETEVTILRGDHNNPKFATSFKKHAEPYLRQIENGTLDTKTDAEIMAKVYADSVIVDWKTLVNDQWKRGIESEDGKSLDAYNFNNVVKILTDLPDLFDSIKAKATKLASFQAAEIKEDAKN